MRIEVIGAEGGSRTRTSLRTTDFKSESGVLTSFYDALPSRIYRPAAKASYVWLGTSTYPPHLPLIFPGHRAQAIRVCRYFLAKEIPIERVRILVSRSASIRVDNVRA